ncbi:hypothetical protein F53441_8235 [Fusarium austroafricanum]|uniref:Hydrophobin n=1 Tax=Fusarium austroafricanum TaxID=2364996 RepID=A0A8H4NXJ5_9HYPO|nr:hypothetical protein F53441_8235 [Fusarium austroafricanum]
MKASIILALPALVAAAATPQVEERQVPNLPNLPLDPTCLIRVGGITSCVTNITPETIIALPELAGCAVGIIVQAALGCVL